MLRAYSGHGADCTTTLWPQGFILVHSLEKGTSSTQPDLQPGWKWDKIIPRSPTSHLMYRSAQPGGMEDKSLFLLETRINEVSLQQDKAAEPGKHQQIEQLRQKDGQTDR